MGLLITVKDFYMLLNYFLTTWKMILDDQNHRVNSVQRSMLQVEFRVHRVTVISFTPSTSGTLVKGETLIHAVKQNSNIESKFSSTKGTIHSFYRFLRLDLYNIGIL